MAMRRKKKGGGGVLVDPKAPIDPETLVRRLLAAFRTPGYQPPVLPTIGMELLALSRRPDVEFGDILKVLEKDPVLAGRVLKISQSPVYAARVEIRSLRQAVTRLGLTNLTDIVLMECMNMRVFRAPGYDEPMQRLRRHSTATAYIARLATNHAGRPDEFSFLCGLLHDVGVAGCMLLLAAVPRKRVVPAFEDVFPAIWSAHQAAGQLLCQLWKLPAHIPTVVGHHHQFVIEEKIHPLAAAVALADGIAGELGFGFDNDVGEEQVVNAQKALRMDEGTLGQLYEDAQKATEHID
jgi:HD-like signal output (HDOD) protein